MSCTTESYILGDDISLELYISYLIGKNNVARMWESRGAYRVLMGSREGKRLLERPRRKWEDNIKMDLQEVGCVGYGLDRAGSR